MVTGITSPVKTDPSPFDGGPVLAWWSDGDLTLVCADSEALAAAAEVAEYAGYTIDQPVRTL